MTRQLGERIAEGMEAEESPPSSQLVTLADVRAAGEVLRGVVLRTPLVPIDEARVATGIGHPRAYLKAESLQWTGSFKVRGAYYAIARLPPARRAVGVVAHSSGNHAQGVAWAARRLGVRAVVVMPSNAPSIKIERARGYGAEVVVVGPASDERAAKAADLAHSQGLTLIDPSDDWAVIAGQGTVGVEMVEQLAEFVATQAAQDPVAGRTGIEPSPLTVLVPIGEADSRVAWRSP